MHLPETNSCGRRGRLSHEADECLFYGTSPSRMYGVEADVCGIEVVGEEELSTLEIALSWPCNGLIRGRKNGICLVFVGLSPRLGERKTKGEGKVINSKIKVIHAATTMETDVKLVILVNI